MTYDSALPSVWSSSWITMVIAVGSVYGKISKGFLSKTVIVQQGASVPQKTKK